MAAEPRAASAAGGDARSEWARSWPTPIVAALGYALHTSYSFSFGTFIGPVQNDLGWSRAAISSALTITSVVAAILVPLVGRLLDRIDPWKLTVPGMIAYGAALASLGFTGHSIWSWWGLWLIVACILTVIQAPLWSAIVVREFSRARGIAFAIVFCGGAFMAAIAPFIAGELIANFGWRIAYRYLALILCLITIPPVAFVGWRRGRRSAVAPIAAPVAGAPVARPPLGDVLRTGKFIRLAIASFLLMLTVTSFLVHFVPILTSKGVPLKQAAAVAGVIGIGSLIGRLFCGVALDRLKGPGVGVASFLIPAIALVAMYFFSGGLGYAYAIALLFGLAVGSEVNTIAYFTAEYFGLENYGALFGVLTGCQAAAFAIGPILAGFIFDRFGNYGPFLLGATPCVLLAVLLVWSLGPYPEKASAD